MQAYRNIKKTPMLLETRTFQVQEYIKKGYSETATLLATDVVGTVQQTCCKPTAHP